MNSVAASYDTTTLLGSYNALSALLPVEFDMKTSLTLNSHFGVLSSTLPTDVPKLRYYGIGIQGCYNADDGILSSAYSPSRLNMNLYTPIPFRCVPVDEDLTDTERSQYRMRVRKTLSNGSDYYLYYLKVLDFSGDIKCKQTITSTGEEVTYDFDPQYLEPTPTAVDSNETVDSSTSSIIAYAEANLKITADEVLEYISIEYGDVRYAKVSEIGLYTGVEQETTGTTSNNVSISYTEGIYVMLHTHMTWIGTALTQSGTEIDTTIRVTSQGSIAES